MKEVFGPFFFVLSRVTNLKEQFCNGPQAILAIILEVDRIDRAFFLGPNRLLKT